MEIMDAHTTGGSLQISTDVVEKIARLATLEVEGVSAVALAAFSAQNLLGKLAHPKAITVDIKNEVADITVSVLVDYGTKIPDLSEKIQKNVKDAVQSMTSITVARVDVLVAGMKATQAD